MPAWRRAEGEVSEPVCVAGILPYASALPLRRQLLEAQPPPKRLVVMVQAEVAESIVAGPGAMSLLGVSIQLYGEPRLLFHVPPSAFYPPPKVRSAVLRIDVAAQPRAGVRDVDAFFRLARAGFSARRKQLRNALSHRLRIDVATAGELLADAAVDPARAQETLSALLAELAKIRDDGVEAEELARAKEFAKGRLLLRMEDTRAVSDWLGAQELLTGHIRTADDVVDLIDAVTEEDLLRVARKLLVADQLNLAVVGPYRSARRFASALKL